jgi:DNA-binding beta-propeller fold protein YncE
MLDLSRTSQDLRRRALVTLTAGMAVLGLASVSHAETYRSPINLAFSPDGSRLAVADPVWGGLVIIDPGKRSVEKEVPLQGNPAYLAWNGDDKILVAEEKTGTIAEVRKDGTFSRRLAVATRATGVAITSNHKTLYVCDRGLNKVVFIDLDKWEIGGDVDVIREPGYIALTPDDKYAVVANKLPRSEDARPLEHGAEVSIIELDTGFVQNVRLPGGSSIVRQIAIPKKTTPDATQWAYVVHQLGRANTMVTQLDKGWVMTNAVSIIDVANASRTTTFLLDHEGAGAANPWGAAVSQDGSKLWVTVAGLSELATVDLTGLHALLASEAGLLEKLSRDLGTMTGKELLHRTPLSDVEGTRGVALSPDGKTLAVAAYFEGKVLLVDVESEKVQAVSLGTNPPEDQTRKGERLYNSGKTCYQGWLTCATCHEGGRMDALNWDLLNDGQGNVKNTRSHMLSSLTPPTNITGCREGALVSARAGYENIEFRKASEKDVVEPTYAYIQSLTPEPSPYLGPDGKLTPDAVEGKKLFESSEVGCSGCHRPPLFTDLQRHDVGTRIVAQDIGDWDKKGYDTPTLVEVWRTAPYLHLGHAVKVREIFTTFNPSNQHGKTSQLSQLQLDQLAAYVMQIGPSADVPSPTSPDAGATTESNTDPVETTSNTPSQGGCICRMGGSPGAPATGSAPWMMVVVASIFLIAFGRRRRCSRSEKQTMANAPVSERTRV